MIAIVLIIGAYEISAGNMTVGGLLTCSLLVGRIIAPIGQLVGSFHRASQSRALLKSLAEETPVRERKRGRRQRRTIRAEGVCPYAERHLVLLFRPGIAADRQHIGDDQPGERIAIVGRSGSGKSTLLRLIARLAEPDQGSILLDGFDVRQYAPAALRDALGYMGKTTGIVDDTLMKNLSSDSRTIDPQHFNALMQLTGVADFVAGHPRDPGVQVGPRGERLSGGERQSVALGPNVTRKPKVPAAR